MFFKLKSNVLFRDYESFGYLTDNRNFGYKKSDNSEIDIGDKIVSESGAVFLSVLGRNPQTLDALGKIIKKRFANVNIRTIRKDAIEFYNNLEQEGFIVSGETLQECIDKDIKFSYKKLEPEIIKEDCFSGIVQPIKSTQEFLEEFFKGKPQLTSLHLEITSKCNERCVHCYIPNDSKLSDIEPLLFYNILEQCKNMRLLHITLSGGEPMLHRNFCDFLRKCNEFAFAINVLSNLTLLNDEILNEMKSNPLLCVQVSLYSMDPIIHDKITQVKGSFEKTKNAILKLIENDIPLQISCPILKQNKDCYEEVVKWSKKQKIHVGADYSIIGGYNHSNQNLSNRLSIYEIKELMTNIVLNDANYLEQIEMAAEKKRNGTVDGFVCSVCHSSICIADNGNVFPCAGWHDYVLGNVKNTPIKDIWDNSKKVHYLRSLRNKDFPKCMLCNDKEFCTICMVRNANENPNGDPLVVSEFFCKIAKLNREKMLECREKF
jgi:radical SAM protein with 4Fe4S-binding SPASM domain